MSRMSQTFLPSTNTDIFCITAVTYTVTNRDKNINISALYVTTVRNITKEKTLSKTEDTYSFWHFRAFLT